MTARFKDHFSGHAAEYSRYRPTYPRALFEAIATLAPGRERAWDCATGSGQAAVALAEYFDQVVATDASALQLESARERPGVIYLNESAERTTLDDDSCDLISVAQALHWFDFDAFYREVRRVARPGAILAAWAYERMRVGAEIDELLDELLDVTLGSFWPPERAYVDSAYASLPFPFRRISEPSLVMELEWSAEQTTRYLRTWSAARRFHAEHDFDPIDRIEGRLVELWGSGVRRVSWPLVLRFGRVD